jgi:hypothetical protein
LELGRPVSFLYLGRGFVGSLNISSFFGRYSPLQSPSEEYSSSFFEDFESYYKYKFVICKFFIGWEGFPPGKLRSYACADRSPNRGNAPRKFYVN